MDQYLIITKFCPPTKLDIQDYKAVWREIKDNDSSGYYVQLSHDTNNPNWVPLATLLVKVWERDMNPELLNKAIELYK